MRIALLISGGGTTASAIITACKTGQLKHVEPVLVIASLGGISGIKRTIEAGIKPGDVAVIDPKSFSSQKAFGEAIIKACAARGAEFVGQYGWLALTPENVIEKFQNLMVNQHPGPLDIGRPDFGGAGMYGKRVHAARLCFVKKTNRDFWSEATAQRVAGQFDRGAVLKRKPVPILPEDAVDALAARILPVEHEVQIETLRDFTGGKVREIARNEPLVWPDEYPILEECKKQAIINYPKG